MQPIEKARLHENRIGARHPRAGDVGFERVAGDDDDRDIGGRAIGGC
jgi:hypothetical protein